MSNDQEPVVVEVTPEKLEEINQYINEHPTEDFGVVRRKFGLTLQQMRPIIRNWWMGQVPTAVKDWVIRQAKEDDGGAQ